MFAEYLDQHPMDTLLAERPSLSFPRAGDRAFWERLPDDLLQSLRVLIDSYAAQPYPMRTASGFLAFVRSGSRKADEDPYFLRRRKLCAAALACCLSPEQTLDSVVDGIWCICEETSWVISAHNVNPIPGAPRAQDYPLPDPARPYIDLFSAQTAMILSLTRHLLKDRLDQVSPLLCQRLGQEIERRVLTPFMATDDFWWMGFRRRDLNNWTPWILSNIMLSACLASLDRPALARLLDRGCRMLDRYLAVLPQDGGCDEGAGYWNMAGGALLDCLQLLEEVTEGRLAFWQNEKIKNILRFPLLAEIGNGWFFNFADCDARPKLSGERLQLAGEKLHDPALFALGCRFRDDLSALLSDTPHFSRLLWALMHHPEAAEAPAERGDVWLPDLQVRVVRRGGLALCCKGGHNGENHNHNDVGSFMLYADGMPQIIDAGNMTYTAKTFSDERYTLWNTRAAYHNLPLIGGTEQQPGREHAASQVQCLPNGLRLHMENAYGPEAQIEALERQMELTEAGCEIHDTVRLHRPQPVTWVFMLRNAPRVSGQTMLTGPIALEIPEGTECEIEEIPVQDDRMARCFPGSLWRVLITAPAADAFHMRFMIRKQEI